MAGRIGLEVILWCWQKCWNTPPTIHFHVSPSLPPTTQLQVGAIRARKVRPQEGRQQGRKEGRRAESIKRSKREKWERENILFKLNHYRTKPSSDIQKQCWMMPTGEKTAFFWFVFLLLLPIFLCHPSMYPPTPSIRWTLINQTFHLATHITASFVQKRAPPLWNLPF